MRQRPLDSSSSPSARARCARSRRVSLPVRPGEAHLVAQALGRRARCPLDLAWSTSASSPRRARAARRRRRRRRRGGSGQPGRGSRRSSRTAIRTLGRGATRRASSSSALRRSQRARARSTWGSAPGLAPGARLRRRARGPRHPGPARRDSRAGEQTRASSLLGGCLLGNVARRRARATRRSTRADVVVVTGHGGRDARLRRRRPAGRGGPRALGHGHQPRGSRDRAWRPRSSRPARPGPTSRSPRSWPTSSARASGWRRVERRRARPSRRRRGVPGALGPGRLGDVDGVVVGRAGAAVRATPARPDGLPGDPLDRDRRPRRLRRRGGATGAVGPTGGATTPALRDLGAPPSVDVPLADAYALARAR